MGNVHYHGTPIWGNKGEVLKVAIKGAGAFVSYWRHEQINLCLEHADVVAIDNGAFSAWRSGAVINWVEFYKWLELYYYHEKVKFFIIPDVITGTEEENDELIRTVPPEFKGKAVPVWHLEESIDKLVRLCHEWDRVAFGSSGEYKTIRSKKWIARMDEAFLAIKESGATVKIHGLRMLDGRVLGNYPLDSADSTNIASNVPKWKEKYPNLGRHIKNRIPFTKEDEIELKVYRCVCLKNAIESVYPPKLKDWFPVV